MGDRIRARRLKLELTQADLAKLAGVGKGMVSAIETGRFMPSLRTVSSIGQALRCGVDTLVYGAAAAQYQPALPGMSLDERVNALPEAMREFVLLSIARAETATRHVPAKFLKSPTSDNWPEYAAYLEAISVVQRRDET